MPFPWEKKKEEQEDMAGGEGHLVYQHPDKQKENVERRSLNLGGALFFAHSAVFIQLDLFQTTLKQSTFESKLLLP